MASYEETLEKLEEMRSRFDTGFSSSDKEIIEYLYLRICGKRVRNTGCKDCWRDAYIETRTKLKTQKVMKSTNYTLKAGAIIHPQGTSKFYSLNNIPDDVAENWLGQFPKDIIKFETFPTDWESRVAARKEGRVAEPTVEELKAEVERLTEVVEQKEVEIETLKTEAGDKSAEEVEALKAEVAAKEAELAAAKEASEKAAAELQIAKEATEKAKAEAETEVADINKTNEELKAEVEKLKAENEALQKKVATKPSPAAKTDK